MKSIQARLLAAKSHFYPNWRVWCWPWKTFSGHLQVLKGEAKGAPSHDGLHSTRAVCSCWPAAVTAALMLIWLRARLHRSKLSVNLLTAGLLPHPEQLPDPLIKTWWDDLDSNFIKCAGKHVHAAMCECTWEHVRASRANPGADGWSSGLFSPKGSNNKPAGGFKHFVSF